MSASNALLDAAFGRHSQIVVPWPTAGRRKGTPLYDRDIVGRYVSEQPRLTEVDPADLYATQTWVLRSHVTHYLAGEWERTGRTSADMHQRANRYPLIYPDERGRLLILAVTTDQWPPASRVDRCWPGWLVRHPRTAWRSCRR